MISHIAQTWSLMRPRSWPVFQLHILLGSEPQMDSRGTVMRAHPVVTPGSIPRTWISLGGIDLSSNRVDSPAVRASSRRSSQRTDAFKNNLLEADEVGDVSLRAPGLPIVEEAKGKMVSGAPECHRHSP